MTFGLLLSELLGWLGDFVQWIFSWVPRYRIVAWNERGVRYPRGNEPQSLGPGVHWLVPNLTRIVVHHVARDVLPVASLACETADGIQVQVGAVVSYRITDVLAWEVDNWSAADNMAEAAQGALQEIVQATPWAKLNGDSSEGTRLGKMLARRMGKELSKFGVEVESCRTTDQVKLRWAARFFGMGQREVAPPILE